MNIIQLIGLYWHHKDSKQSWFILGLIIGLQLIGIYFMVLMAKWNAIFFNALSQVDRIAFWQSLQMFIGLVGGAVLIAMYQQYFKQMLYIHWRKWLTEHLTAQWLDDSRYYQLYLKQSNLDNPDQRLSQDIHLFTYNSLDLGLGFIHSLLTLCSFISMLWLLSGNVSFVILGITISHYMVWVALAYALIGSLLSHYIGHYLIKLNYKQQQYDANFRYQLVQIRDHAEDIALSRQERWHSQQLNHQFQSIWQNWWQIMTVDKRLKGFSSAYQRLSLIIPHLAAAPQYFMGKLSIGELMQTASAFSYVQQALSWFIDAYSTLTEWKATANRLLEFQQSLKSMPTLKPLKVAENQQWFSTKITAYTPLNQQKIVEITDLNLLPHQIYQIQGENGAGKSVLMKILAGIWTDFEGEISRPAGKIIFLSANPYIPKISLVEFFNQDGNDYSKEQIQAVLNYFKLEHLLVDKNNDVAWKNHCSDGQLQAVMLARACLLKPDWLMLDEAFNAISMDLDEILKRLKHHHPPMGICFISHQAQK